MLGGEEIFIFFVFIDISAKRSFIAGIAEHAENCCVKLFLQMVRNVDDHALKTEVPPAVEQSRFDHPGSLVVQ